MGRYKGKVIPLTLVLIVLLAGARSTPVWAHAGNRVQLYMNALQARPEGVSTWRLKASLVDSDSGRPAAGFLATASGTDAGRSSFGPVPLTDEANKGEYSGLIQAAPGSWSVTVRAAETPGGDPAVPLVKMVTLHLVSGQSTDDALAPGERTDAVPGPDAPRLQVRLEHGDETISRQNWMSLRTTVTDLATGKGVTEGVEVYVTGSSPAGDKTEAFAFPPEGQEGVFGGFVIVPRGGHWTFTASVNRVRPPSDKRPPVTFARATFEADVVGSTLESGQAASAANSRGVKANALEAAVLWIHTLVAIGWILLVLLLALVSHPGGRRLFSDRGTNLFDSRLEALIRAMWWLTTLVLLTGIYNIVKSTPYRPPITLAQMQQVFRLPYGRIYYVTLCVKLVTYAAMIGAAIPVVSRARRATLAWSQVTTRRPYSPAVAAQSPWGTVASVPVGTVAAESSSTVLTAIAPYSQLAPDQSPASGGGPVAAATRDHAAFSGHLLSVALGGGAVILTLAVTLLKYFHLLSEAVRRI